MQSVAFLESRHPIHTTSRADLNLSLFRADSLPSAHLLSVSNHSLALTLHVFHQFSDTGDSSLLHKGFNLVDFSEDMIHVLEADAFRLGPKQSHHDQTDEVDAHQDPVGVVAHAAKHHGPRLVDPQRGDLLAGLGDVDALVADMRGENLAGVDPCGWAEGAAVSLSNSISS